MPQKQLGFAAVAVHIVIISSAYHFGFVHAYVNLFGAEGFSAAFNHTFNQLIGSVLIYAENIIGVLIIIVYLPF